MENDRNSENLNPVQILQAMEEKISSLPSSAQELLSGDVQRLRAYLGKQDECSRAYGLFAVDYVVRALSSYSRDDIIRIAASELSDEETRQIFEARVDQWLADMPPELSAEQRIALVRKLVSYSLDGIQTEKALKSKEAELREAQRIAHIGSWYWDAQTDVTSGSEELMRIFGLNPESDTMPPFSKQKGFLYTDADWERLNEAVQTTMRTGAGYTFDLPALRHGEQIWVTNRSEVVRDSSGKIIGMRGTTQDITEHKQFEEALRVSEAKERNRAKELEALMDTVPALIWISRDSSCTEMIGNRFGYQFLKMGPQDNLSKTAPEEQLERQPYRNCKDGRLLPPEELPMQIAAGTGTPARDYQFDILFNNGEIAHLLGNVNALFDAQGKPSGAVGAFIDITPLRNLQNQQIQAIAEREVHHRLMEQREKERQSYARDIHDGPVQTLSSIGFNLQYIKEAYPDPSLRLELDQIGLSVKNAVQELRQMINELRPPSVLRFGLTRAIRHYAEDIGERYPQITWNYRLSEDANHLPEQMCLALYRIYQEAVTNIIRHSQASKVWVNYQVKARKIILEIRDDGRGFERPNDIDVLTRNNHFGLAGIIERAEAIGGTVKITSEPSQGTKILVTAPKDRS